MKKILLILVMAISFVMPSFAENWYWIGTSKSGEQWFIDNDSVIKDNQEATVWIKANLPDGTSELSRITITRDYRFKQLSYLAYDMNGKVIKNVPMDLWGGVRYTTRKYSRSNLSCYLVIDRKKASIK